MQCRLFPLLEEEIGEITEKLQEFLRIIELVKPARFITGPLSWCELGRRLKKRENMLRAYSLKSVYDLPTTFSTLLYFYSHDITCWVNFYIKVLGCLNMTLSIGYL